MTYHEWMKLLNSPAGLALLAFVGFVAGWAYETLRLALSGRRERQYWRLRAELETRNAERLHRRQSERQLREASEMKRGGQ